MSTSIIAIVAITILNAIALLKGIDGLLMSGCIAVIAGLGGLKIRDAIDAFKRGNER